MSSPASLTLRNTEGALLRKRWFPMGYPLDITTNSEEVFYAAAQIWGEFPQISPAAPIELDITVSPDNRPSPRIATPPRHSGHVMTIMHEQGNFAIADMATGRGLIRVNYDVVQDTAWFLYHFLEPVAYVLLGARHFLILHAACIAVDKRAVLLCGPSGAGKTCLAYACARRGWLFISGDATHVIRDDGESTVVGRPFSIRLRHSASSVFGELNHFRPNLRPSGKYDLEIDTRELRIPVALSARPAMIVFLNRLSRPCRPLVEKVAREDARARLSGSICFGGEDTRTAQKRTLERLITVPLLRLTYADPFEAERILQKTLTGAS